MGSKDGDFSAIEELSGEDLDEYEYEAAADLLKEAAREIEQVVERIDEVVAQVENDATEVGSETVQKIENLERLNDPLQQMRHDLRREAVKQRQAAEVDAESLDDAEEVISSLLRLSDEVAKTDTKDVDVDDVFKT